VKLTEEQLSTFRERYCEMILDQMDWGTLQTLAYDLLLDNYEKFNQTEIEAEIEDLYDEDVLKGLQEDL
jgi:hypothetical protein